MIRFLKNTDYMLFLSLIPLLFAGLMTMKIFGAGNLSGQAGDYFFNRQLIWIGISFATALVLGASDLRFLKNGALLLIMYVAGIAVLGSLFAFGRVSHGSASWLGFSALSLEPVEPMKIILILVLAKYFARRHVEIANIKHIIISAFFAGLPTALVLLQPDFGSAMVLVAVWLGMIMVSGVSKKHLALVFILGALLFFVGWEFVLVPYQKLRILTFLDPLMDPLGAGYNAVQAMVAVGSGGWFGRGIGQGTQSRLEFLPEHETDFIFAAFAEEWGFVGAAFLFLFFGILLWRIIRVSFNAHSNFEKLFSMGLAILIFSHIFINVGMNIGLLPITGITLPFTSYGGSALLSLFVGIGILQSMRKYSMDMPGYNVKSDLLEGV